MKFLSFIIIPLYYSECHNDTVFRSCQDIREHAPTFPLLKESLFVYIKKPLYF